MKGPLVTLKTRHLRTPCVRVSCDLPAKVPVSPLPPSMQDYEIKPAEKEADDSARNPDPRRSHVSTSDPRNRGKNDDPWRRTVYGEPPERDPRTGRCNRCTTCKNVAKLGCTSQRDPNPCLGCLRRSPCWGMRPCEFWSLLEEGCHYSEFALQAYNNPSANNRVDLITQSPYRFDLDTKSMLRLPYHPITQVDLGPPPEPLRGTWDAAKEYVMIRRMLGQPETSLKPRTPALEDQEEAEPRRPKKRPSQEPTSERRSVPTSVLEREPPVNQSAGRSPFPPGLDLEDTALRDLLQRDLVARNLLQRDLGDWLRRIEGELAPGENPRRPRLPGRTGPLGQPSQGLLGQRQPIHGLAQSQTTPPPLELAPPRDPDLAEPPHGPGVYSYSRLPPREQGREPLSVSGSNQENSGPLWSQPDPSLESGSFLHPSSPIPGSPLIP